MAQTKFSGKVLNGKDSNPISLAEIVLLNDKSEISNVTDEQGNFLFENVETGNYDFAILVNFDTIYTEKIQINADLTKSFKVNMPNIDLKEVVIAKKVFQKKADRFVFDVSNSPVAKGNDAFNLLKQTPLVSSTDGKNLKILNKSDVIIYINGRKSNMDNEAVIEMLKNTPSENIQKIEVITTPGSEFSVEANTGVINIVMKTTTTNGLNGNVRFVDQQAYFNSQRLNAGLNYRKDKLAINSGIYTGNNKSREKNILSNGNDHFINESRGIVDDPNTNVGGNVGFDYELAKNQNIGLTYNFRYNKSFGSKFKLDNYYNHEFKNQTINLENAQTRNHSFNLNHEVRIDSLGSKLVTNASFLNYKREMRSTNTTIPADNENIEIFRQNVPQIINNFSANADYTLKTKNENTWLFGGSYTFTKTDNDTKQENFVNENFITDETLSNHFLYKENIAGLYLTFEKQVSEKFSGKIGTRFEITKTDGDILDKNNSFKNNYNNILPYLSLNYAVHQNHNLSYSFSSRVRRPAFWELNPSRVYLTQTNYIQNNPFMMSSKYYKQEFNYLYKNAYFFNAEFEYIDDATSQLPLQGTVKNIETGETTEFLRYIRMNYGNKKSLNLSVGMNKSFYDGIWSTNYILVYMYQTYRGTINSDPTYIPKPGFEENLSPYVVDRQSSNIYFKLDNTIRLSSKKDWFLGINYWYLSPFEIELGKLGKQHSFDVNIKKIWNNWTLMFEAYDLFNTNITTINGKQENGNFNNVWQQSYNREFSISLSYKFGNQKLKKSRQIDEANSTIKSRL
ncbi:outer membrane beta-barrel protein [Empedobacter brevis]|uniref:Outer membrane beta-barrel protein n=2 Tax=Empedobacter brevis TaxID=247 RepID=A0AAJ1V7T1_9FLAO|nr:outer membrane beta-barrel protein [Empedobacter brevis]QHC85339.1 TonB-dependent receptor [Empedobacter brevis]